MEGSAAPRWRLLWPVLACAFALRATLALTGDSQLHPDEVHQYLEPAHLWVFGYGVVSPEWHYGARQHWIPGLVAAVLKGLDAAGLGRPEVYIPAVELVLCALSLAIPLGMYGYARHAWGEASGRAALLAGSLWYELAAMASKPMTEMVATAPLLLLLWAAQQPGGDRARHGVLLATLAVAAGSLRSMYAPLAAVVLAHAWRGSGRRARGAMAAAAALLAGAVGAADGALWSGAPFHSYLLHMR